MMRPAGDDDKSPLHKEEGEQREHSYTVHEPKPAGAIGQRTRYKPTRGGGGEGASVAPREAPSEASVRPNAAEAHLSELPHINAADYESLDGITHINVYSKGRTELGQRLAHWAHTPFVHPHYGSFNSMEAFWHWLKSANRPDELRLLWSNRARDMGRNLPMRKSVPYFYEIINEANYLRIEQHARLKELFVDSVLPFDYYYLHGESAPVLVRPMNYDWLVRGFEYSRLLMKAGKRLPSPPYS